MTSIISTLNLNVRAPMHYEKTKQKNQKAYWTSCQQSNKVHVNY